MRLSLVVILLLVLSCLIRAQQPGHSYNVDKQNVSVQKSQVLLASVPESDCSNGIDDNANGLTDLDDFHCYFNEGNFPNTCPKSKILWASSNEGIHSINIESGSENFYPYPQIGYYDDLTWCANGKLYGAGDAFSKIYSIDPYTFERTLVGEVPGHYFTNGMTGDASGNLYLCSFRSDGSGCDIVYFNVTSGDVKVVVDLSQYGLSSAGDLCFLNGFLYVSCMDSKLAKIDMATKSVTTIPILNSPSAGSFGLTTLGDGYLYISNNVDKIYRLNPETGEAVYLRSFNQLNVFVTGFASYPDLCNAPCKVNVSISVNSTPPFCSNTGVSLGAKGSGIANKANYLWTLPDGSGVNNPSIAAVKSGDYRVRYHTDPDTCGAEDVVHIDLTPFPEVSLGNDTAICATSVYVLSPKTSPAIQSFTWQDQQKLPAYPVHSSGKYWVTANNVCGSASDTVIITEKEKPTVKLGNDTLICKYASLSLANELYSSGFGYLWSSGSRAEKIEVNKPGLYWLEVDNSCEADKVRDTIVVGNKIDGCECFMYIPNAFTPNNDGINDFFNLRSSCNVVGTISIYNRWGEQIYFSTELATGWDGRLGNKNQPTGLYVYVIQFEYKGHPGKFSRKGMFNLIR